MFVRAEYTDEEHTAIKAVDASGKVAFVPIDKNNRDYLIIAYGDEEKGQPPLKIAEQVS